MSNEIEINENEIEMFNNFIAAFQLHILEVANGFERIREEIDEQRKDSRN